jgi:hypothetical protein
MPRFGYGVWRMAYGVWRDGRDAWMRSRDGRSSHVGARAVAVGEFIEVECFESTHSDHASPSRLEPLSRRSRQLNLEVYRSAV